MIDRLVYADGGNPDPTSTGDASGTENLRRIITDWMTDIGMHVGHHALLTTTSATSCAPASS